MKDVKMIDIVFLTMPKVGLRLPLIGPNLMKSIAIENGYTAKTIDYNIRLWHQTRHTDIQKWWIDDDRTFSDRKLFNWTWDNYFKNIAKEWIEELKNINPRFIGITVLGHWCYIFTEKFIKFLNKELPDVKIITGGPAASDKPVEWLKQGLTYANVQGEGEKALIEVLNGNLSYPGVNGNEKEQLDDLNTIPFADYSDVDFSLYSSESWRDPDAEPDGCKWLPITGSRGCIKKCTFCNIPSYWKKYRYKNGKRIVDELEHYVNTTGVSQYQFTDALLNGDINQLSEIASTILEKNLKIKWSGQWIARGEKLMPDSLWKTLSDAGLFSIAIGIESGSAKVRNDMKKGVREEDIEYTFEKCLKYNIKIIPLMLIGYPTETRKEFEKNMQFLYRYQKYAQTGIVDFMNLGPTMAILPNTPIAKTFDGSYDENGYWYKNDNNMATRIERWFEYRDTAKKLGWPLFPLRESNTRLISIYKEITGKDLTKKYPLDDGVKVWLT